MENIKQLFYEDIREKNKIARSSRVVHTKFPVLIKDDRRSAKGMEFDKDNVKTAEDYEALTLEQQKEWLEEVRKYPGYKKQGELMGGLKYHWFADRKKRVDARISAGKDKATPRHKEGYNMNNAGATEVESLVTSIMERKLKTIENRVAEKLGETLNQYIEKVQEKSQATEEILKNALQTLDSALVEVREKSKQSNKTDFEGGYFINREMDADPLSKRLSKLADSIGITDSRYKVMISIIELDN